MQSFYGRLNPQPGGWNEGFQMGFGQFQSKNQDVPRLLKYGSFAETAGAADSIFCSAVVMYSIP